MATMKMIDRDLAAAELQLRADESRRLADQCYEKYTHGLNERDRDNWLRHQHKSEAMLWARSVILDLEYDEHEAE